MSEELHFVNNILADLPRKRGGGGRK